MSFGLLSRRRGWATVCVCSATLILGVLFVVSWAGVAAAHDQEVSFRTAGQLIEAAGRAKADGRPALAYSLLHKVVRIAPDNSLARWQLGQVKVDREWLSVEEAQRRAEADPRLAKYQERKEVLGDSPKSQLVLARWCRGNKLEDEAQVHWSSVLSANPNNKEALRATGMRWHDGELKSVAQIREVRLESSEAKQATRRWAARVAGWLRALADKKEKTAAAIEEIRAVDDLAAIPAFEDVTLKGPQAANEKNTVIRRLSLAFVSALDKLHDEAATESLLRHAVMSSFVDVRAQAIGELRYRPLEEFVPTLLDNFIAPMKSAYRVVNDPDGSVHYLHSVYREGPFTDWSYRTERSIYRPESPFGIAAGVAANVMPVNDGLPGLSSVSNSPARAVSRAGAARSAQNYEQEIVNREREVAEANEKTVAINERIVSVLTGTTDKSFGSEPRAWWDWWSDHTDYYHGGTRPVMSTVDSSSDYIVPPVQYGSPAVECFARGTPVWTKTGQRPIEKLQAGDLVLAQNVSTGEIRYKPVLARTLRPAGPIVQVSTDDEKILSTRGHPLWVAGVGWRMTKELGDGAVLQSLAGTGRVKRVRSAPDAETYNLVVADFNTYFVGSSGILAHDNTPHRSTQAVLPGILKK
jgi:Pretoxin HINT domain